MVRNYRVKKNNYDSWHFKLRFTQITGSLRYKYALKRINFIYNNIINDTYVDLANF